MHLKMWNCKLNFKTFFILLLFDYLNFKFDIILQLVKHFTDEDRGV